MEGMGFDLMNKLRKNVEEAIYDHPKYTCTSDIHVHILEPLHVRIDMSVLLPASGDFIDVWYVNVKGWDVK